MDKNLIEKANQLTTWARTQGHLVGHVRVGFNPHYHDSSTISPVFSKAKEFGALNLSEWGAQFCDDVERDANDFEVIKHRVSPFYGTDLDLILRANRIEHIIFCGVATNNAVELATREAHDRDYKVTVVADVTETANDEEQQASIHFMQKIASVVGAADLLLTK